MMITDEEELCKKEQWEKTKKDIKSKDIGILKDIVKNNQCN